MWQLIDRTDTASSRKSMRSLPLTCKHRHPALPASACSLSDLLGTQPEPGVCLNTN